MLTLSLLAASPVLFKIQLIFSVALHDEFDKVAVGINCARLTIGDVIVY